MFNCSTGLEGKKSVFLRFYALIKNEEGTERTESVDCKNLEVAKDYFETLYSDDFTGQVWAEEGVDET